MATTQKAITTSWDNAGREAYRMGVDLDRLKDGMSSQGLTPARNEWRAAVRGWRQENVAELRREIRRALHFS